MRSTHYAGMFCLALLGSALAQHPVPPTTVNDRYDMTTWTPIAVGSCTGEGTGCTTVYGFDWLSDGRMVLLTNDYLGHDQKPANRAKAKVSIIANPNSGLQTITTIASHFKQPGGVKVVNDSIWVSDMDTVYLITNLSPAAVDTPTNKIRMFGAPLSSMHGGSSAPYNFAFNKATCSGGLSGCTSSNSQAHHYIMTPIYYQGKFYAAYGGATGSGNGLSNLNASSFYASAVLMWDRTTSVLDTNANRFAGGLRSPDGTAIGPGSSFFVTDHQGSWLPMNTLTLYKFSSTKKQFGGYRQDAGYSANWAQAWYDRDSAVYVPPVAINRYDQSGKTGWVGIAQPFYLTQGTYAGQVLVGDINSRGLWRVALDTLNDTTGSENVQGAVFYFTPGNSGNTLGTGNAGNNRITQGPDGTIYAGGGRGVGNWGGGAAASLVYVFKPAVSSDQFEVMQIRSLSDGYELYMSEKVDPSTVTTGKFSVGQRNWVRQSAYGGGFSPANTGGTTTGASNFTTRTVTSVAVSDDSLRIRLVVSGIQRINQGRRGDSVTHWHTRFLFTGGGSGLKSATGTTLYTTEADYAQNWISTRNWDGSGSPTAVRKPPMGGLLGNDVWVRTGNGLLNVHVDNRKRSYAIVLRDLHGREVFRRSDISPATPVTEIRSSGTSQSVYTLEVRSGSELATRIVTF